MAALLHSPALLLPLFLCRSKPSLFPSIHRSRCFSPRRPIRSRTVTRPGFSCQEEDFDSAVDLLFDPPMKIVEYPDPILRAKNRRISTFDGSLKKLVYEMFDVMYKTDGIGLSAPQVGINVKLMVFNPAGERGAGEEIVLVNPIAFKASEDITLFNEGCLSFPGIFADVERPVSVKVDAQDLKGRTFRVNLSGLPARVFQHEFDHLQGTLFLERMCEEALGSVRFEVKALERKYEERTGMPSPENIDTYIREAVAGVAKT